MNPETQQVDAREAFRSVAMLYRKRKRQTIWMVFPALAFLGFAMLALPFRYVILTTLSIIGLIMVTNELTPRLICPVCRKRADGELEKFCPVCGHPSIEAPLRGVRAEPKCGHCGKELVRGRNSRLYHICFCTRCSAHLDDSGM